MQRIVVGLALVFLVTQSCGVAPSNDGGVPLNEDAGVVVTDAGVMSMSTPERTHCRLVVEARAALDRRCGALSDAGIDARVVGELAACEAFPGATRDFDVDASNACLAAWRNAGCETVIDETLCNAAAPGNVVLGGGCHASTDCAGGAYCDRSSTCPGVCATRVALGGAVTDGAECVLEGHVLNDVCTARVALGASCAPLGPSVSPECVRGAYCNSSLRCVAEVHGDEGDDCRVGWPACARGLACGRGCVRAGRVGDACDPWDSPCQADLNCVGNVCTPRGTTGARCDLSDVKCAPSYFCQRGGFDGVCQPRSALGGSCRVSDFFACEDGLYCENSTCVAKLAVGAACQHGDQCPAFTDCEGGVCTARGAAGASCSSGSDCLSGLCVASKCTVSNFCPAW